MRYLIAIVLIGLLATPAYSQFSTFNDSDGRSGTIYNFGNGFSSYQDNKGNTGTIYQYGNSGFQGYQFSGPSGPTSGIIYTYPNIVQPFNPSTSLFGAPIVPQNRQNTEQYPKSFMPYRYER